MSASQTLSRGRGSRLHGAPGLRRYGRPLVGPYWFIVPAVVMLSTLSLGLATGVGLYALAAFSTLFLLVVLWLIESFEPERRKTFELKIAAPDPTALRNKVEALLRRYNVTYALRTAGPKELVYEAQLPWDVRTDRLSNAILKLEPQGEKEVVWDEKKKK